MAFSAVSEFTMQIGQLQVYAGNKELSFQLYFANGQSSIWHKGQSIETPTLDPPSPAIQNAAT